MKPKIPDGWIVTGWSGCLYPSAAQRARFNQWAGSLRFVWNRLRAREEAAYAADGTFLWRKELQKIAVGMKYEAGTEWLADVPAHAVLDAAIRMDAALKRMVSERRAGRRCGFPRPKKKFVNEAGVYCVGQATRIETRERARGGVERSEACAVTLPKVGRVRLRGGAVPREHKLLSARISRDGERWRLSVQFAMPPRAAAPAAVERVGMDVGLTNLAVAFDGADFDRTDPPRPLVAAMKRLKRAQRKLSRRKKGSARRRAQAKRVAALHRKVRNRRLDFLHQVSHRLTAKAGAIVVETLDVASWGRDRRLSRSAADAAVGTLRRFVAYKADWRGRTLIAAPADFPSTRMCCRCGELHDMPLGKRVMSCGCGNTMDRDENAAVNLYRYPEEPDPARKGE